jgi:hypothetical protein
VTGKSPLKAPVTPLHRVFATPDDVADVAEGLVRHRRTPGGEYGAEWDGAAEVRAAIEKFHRQRAR